MTKNITAIKGFKDILPDEAGKWQYCEAAARKVFTAFGFREIRVPILEKTGLFQRSLGDTTDIVEKEMYTFLDPGDENVTLRPEATASVIRAVVEHNLLTPGQVIRLFTIGPMFRRERPQKGRYRQFHQINVELLGLDHPATDAELMMMLMHFFTTLDLSELHLQINSLGCPECRPPFRQAMIAHLTGKDDELCVDCRRRITVNPLRILDCKVEQCGTVGSGAPLMERYLCPECRTHFDAVRRYLKDFHLDYTVNPRMVRGLDYYTKTAFEVTARGIGAQSAIAGGGRYNGLIRELGGEDVPGIGFAVGFERLVSLLPQPDKEFTTGPLLFIIAQGDQSFEKALRLANLLRLRGIAADLSYTARSMKSQMKLADRLGCSYVLLMGEQDILSGNAQLRDMRISVQTPIALEGIESTLIHMFERGVSCD